MYKYPLIINTISLINMIKLSEPNFIYLCFFITTKVIINPFSQFFTKSHVLFLRYKSNGGLNNWIKSKQLAWRPHKYLSPINDKKTSGRGCFFLRIYSLSVGHYSREANITIPLPNLT